MWLIITAEMVHFAGDVEQHLQGTDMIISYRATCSHMRDDGLSQDLS